MTWESVRLIRSEKYQNKFHLISFFEEIYSNHIMRDDWCIYDIDST